MAVRGVRSKEDRGKSGGKGEAALPCQIGTMFSNFSLMVYTANLPFLVFVTLRFDRLLLSFICCIATS